MSVSINVRDVPDDVWRRFKVLAAQRETTLREQTIEAVTRFLESHEQRETS